MNINDDLFNYITTELYSHGGDGDVLVLFKQQDPNEVANQFETWLSTQKHATLKRQGIVFSDFSNETIAFGRAFPEGTNVKKELSERRQCCDFSWPWRQWDTTIITW